MNRRRCLFGALALMALAAPLRAAGTDDVVRQLRQQGYDRIVVGRTLLGRIRIQAERQGQRREIIVNRGTGEILRDWSEVDDDLLDDRNSGSGAGSERSRSDN